jgi:hypothetical protein
VSKSLKTKSLVLGFFAKERKEGEKGCFWQVDGSVGWGF